MSRWSECTLDPSVADAVIQFSKQISHGQIRRMTRSLTKSARGPSAELAALPKKWAKRTSLSTWTTRTPRKTRLPVMEIGIYANFDKSPVSMIQGVSSRPWFLAALNWMPLVQLNLPRFGLRGLPLFVVVESHWTRCVYMWLDCAYTLDTITHL